MYAGFDYTYPCAEARINSGHQGNLLSVNPANPVSKRMQKWRVSMPKVGHRVWQATGLERWLRDVQCCRTDNACRQKSTKIRGSYMHGCALMLAWALCRK